MMLKLKLAAVLQETNFTGAFGNKVTKYDDVMKPNAKSKRMRKLTTPAGSQKPTGACTPSSFSNAVIVTLSAIHCHFAMAPDLQQYDESWRACLVKDCRLSLFARGWPLQGEHEQGQPHSYVKKHSGERPQEIKVKHNQANAVSGEGKRHNLRPRSLHAKPSDFTVPCMHWSHVCALAQTSWAVVFASMMGRGGRGVPCGQRTATLTWHIRKLVHARVPASVHPRGWHAVASSCHIQNKSQNARAKQSGRPLSSNRLNVRCALSIYLSEASASEPASLSILTPLGSRPSAAWRWPKPAAREFRKRLSLSSASQHPFRSIILCSLSCIALLLIKVVKRKSLSQ